MSPLKRNESKTHRIENAAREAARLIELMIDMALGHGHPIRQRMAPIRALMRSISLSLRIGGALSSLTRASVPSAAGSSACET